MRTTNKTDGRSIYEKEGERVPDNVSETNDSEERERVRLLRKSKDNFTRRLRLTHAVCVVANCEEKGEGRKKNTQEKTKKEDMLALPLASAI